MSIEVRPLLADEPNEDAAFERLLKVDLAAFSASVEPDALEDGRAVAELDRTWVAWDGKDPVGCSAIYSYDMSVPGGSVPVAGVTWVGVLPTHRRRGAMTALLGALHASIHDAGTEPVAALWASQPPIYGRFGYGLGSLHLNTVIERAHGTLTKAPHDANLTLRLVGPSEDAQWTLPVYRAIRAERPGMPELDDRWQANSVSDPKSERDGYSELQTVLVEDDAGVRGYARYAFKHDWSVGHADGTVSVRQIVAVDPAAEAALWRFLIEFDLSARVRAWNVPIDSPLPHWLDQPRHNTYQRMDAMYVKLIDVADALQRRTYSCAVDVVVDVTDTGSPWNSGRWRLSGDESGATCVKTSDPADISLDIRILAGAYLGSIALNDLAAAGWVSEHTEGVVRATSAAFSHFPAAWCPLVF